MWTRVKDGGLSRRGLLSGVAAGGVGLVAAGPVMAAPTSPSAVQSMTSVGWVNVTDHGVVGDGSADDQPALLSIMGGVGANATLYFPAGSYRLGGNLELPPSVAVILDCGAVLEPDSGATLTVHCGVQAGLYPIFGGAGVTVGSFAGVQVMPQWFGAVADGVSDDAPAIRAAVDAVHAGGGGTVFLPVGTYLLQDTVGDPAVAGNHPFIIPRSGVHLVGAGDGSVLKAADGLNSTLEPGFNVIYIPDNSQANRVDNASFRKFKVDCNGLNNLQEGTGAKARNAAIGVRWGSNIVIDSVTVVNNAGRQCFQFGNNQNPQTVTNLRIANCYIDTFGQGVDGNIHQNDHSVIYAQADGCVITGNVIVQPPGGANNEPVEDATAIELHSKNALVTDNVVQYVTGFMNLTATVSDVSGVVVANNVARYISKAIHVWTQPGLVCEEVLIQGNVFHQSGLGQFDSYPYDFGLVEASVSVKSQASDLTVVDNKFVYDVSAAPDNGRPCMVFGAVRNVVARGNKIFGFPGAGIQIQESFTGPPAVVEPSSVKIEGNEIVDCGQNPDLAKRAGVNLVSGDNITLVVIRDNLFQRTVSGAMDVGVKTSLVAGAVRISGDTWLGVPASYSWSASSFTNTLVVDHVGPGDPIADVVPASVGSTWANPWDGKYWFKDSGNGAAGWQLR